MKCTPCQRPMERVGSVVTSDMKSIETMWLCMACLKRKMTLATNPRWAPLTKKERIELERENRPARGGKKTNE